MQENVAVMGAKNTFEAPEQKERGPGRKMTSTILRPALKKAGIAGDWLKRRLSSASDAARQTVRNITTPTKAEVSESTTTIDPSINAQPEGTEMPAEELSQYEVWAISQIQDGLLTEEAMNLLAKQNDISPKLAQLLKEKGYPAKDSSRTSDQDKGIPLEKTPSPENERKQWFVNRISRVSAGRTILVERLQNTGTGVKVLLEGFPKNAVEMMEAYNSLEPKTKLAIGLSMTAVSMVGVASGATFLAGGIGLMRFALKGASTKAMYDGLEGMLDKKYAELGNVSELRKRAAKLGALTTALLVNFAVSTAITNALQSEAGQAVLEKIKTFKADDILSLFSGGGAITAATDIMGNDTGTGNPLETAPTESQTQPVAVPSVAQSVTAVEAAPASVGAPVEKAAVTSVTQPSATTDTKIGSVTTAPTEIRNTPISTPKAQDLGGTITGSANPINNAWVTYGPGEMEGSPAIKAAGVPPEAAPASVTPPPTEQPLAAEGKQELAQEVKATEPPTAPQSGTWATTDGSALVTSDGSPVQEGSAQPGTQGVPDSKALPNEIQPTPQSDGTLTDQLTPSLTEPTTAQAMVNDQPAEQLVASQSEPSVSSDYITNLSTGPLPQTDSFKTAIASASREVQRAQSLFGVGDGALVNATFTDFLQNNPSVTVAEMFGTNPPGLTKEQENILKATRAVLQRVLPGDVIASNQSSSVVSVLQNKFAA